MNDEYHSKRYEPTQIDLENRNSSHVLIIELTGNNKRVLEVGTSTGYMSRILKEMGNNVTGIEIDREAAENAARYCDSMIIGDVEKMDLDLHFTFSSFDVIIFSDVLEHLVHPEEMLRKIKKYLRPDGYLAVSLPNICHGDIIIKMLMGNFEYTPMGLLDITHLRFFGLKNIVDLFSKCGFALTDVHTTVMPVSYTEQRIDPDIVPDILLAALKSLPDANVYQYVFRARLSSDRMSFDLVPVPDLLDIFEKAFESIEQTHTHCYIDTGDGFSEGQKISQRIYPKKTNMPFQISFDLKESSPIRSLRWDPVEDRLCNIRIDDILVETTHGDIQKIEPETLVTNGDRISKNEYRFTTIDPWLIIPVDGSLRTLKLSGSWLFQDIFDPIPRFIQEVTQLIDSNQSLQAVLSSRDMELYRLKEETVELQAVLSSRDMELYRLREETIELQAAISSRDMELYRLREETIELQAALSSRNGEVESLNREVHIQSGHLSAVSEEKIRLQQQYDQVLRASHKFEEELYAIKQSVAHQLMMKFHCCFIERLFPPDTIRRINYDRFLYRLRIVVGQGPSNIRWYFREWRGQRRLQRGKHLHGTIPNIPLLSDTDTPVSVIDRKVTVIIPTKNAGDSFEYTLRRIRDQKGVLDIDIVIIDSGSEDETLANAEKYGARIQRIAPETFNHGKTRNLGASIAQGDYLVFTVQDALPIGEYWLYSMVQTLEDNEHLVAVTCRQIPSSNADLFACFGLWHHYSVTLQLNEDRIYHGGDDFDNLPVEEKRRRSGLENVCCCIRKNIFDTYKFKDVLSSEDLDLGIRLMREGYKLGYLFSTGVIHSHNRAPNYFFRRSYVDTRTVSEIVGLNTQAVCVGCDGNGVVGSILTLYATLNRVADSIYILSLHDPPEVLIEKIKVSLRENVKERVQQWDISSGKPLDNLFKDIFSSVPDISPISHEKQSLLLLDQYLWVLREFMDFLRIYPSLEDKKDDFILSLYKLFAVVAGASLSSYYLQQADNAEGTDQIAMSLNTMMCEGV